MKNLRYILSSLFLTAAFLCAGAASLPVKRAAASEKINMGSIFSDNMVLQREKKVEIYGQAEAGRKVSVSFNGQLKTCTADEYGRFLVELDGMRADATGKTLTVSAGGAEKRFENVLIGEVYYGSGQSNMAYPMDEFTYAESVIEADPSYGEDYEKYNARESYLEAFKDFKNYHLLRFYTQKMLPETNGVVNKGECNVWTVPASVNDLKYTSLTAVAYAIQLSQKLENVPVGIIVSAVGGSRIHEWIDEKAAARIFPGNGDSTLSQRYRNMLLPMGSFTVRGALWYQGESDVYGDLETYRLCFKAWLEETRRFFKDESLPVITFQLPQYEDESCKGLWPAFRQLQEKLAKECENVYYVCGIDLGDHRNIHPVDKYEFCERAAGLALKYIYGKEYSGEGSYGKNPEVCGLWRKKGGDTVYMRFSDAEKVFLSEGTAYGLSATSNKQAYVAIPSYRSVGKRTVSFKTKLKYVSYLQENVFDYGTAFLYNEFGLPVAPFVEREVQTYDFDVSAECAGGSVEGDERFFLSAGSDASFSFVPKDGYVFKSLSINGAAAALDGGRVELKNVSEDIAVVCVFEKAGGMDSSDQSDVVSSVMGESDKNSEDSSKEKSDLQNSDSCVKGCGSALMLPVVLSVCAAGIALGQKRRK